LKGLSVLRGNSSGAFLGEGVAAMSSSYPTRPDGIFGRDRLEKIRQEGYVPQTSVIFFG
jgi:hypothetical protein